MTEGGRDMARTTWREEGVGSARVHTDGREDGGGWLTWLGMNDLLKLGRWLAWRNDSGRWLISTMIDGGDATVERRVAEQVRRVNQSEYASFRGNLRYAVDYARPDIAYAVGLLCYNDVDWNSLLDDSKATNGYIFNIVRGVVAWKSKEQTILAHSIMESKMIALATASEEAS
ncbi:pentatricopeptide repeat-containing protein [Cucumis melo var. makuwa]|uniref:Pentatricopeptide repeat-containing protein n=1 Tax=Cucumis melo var. makuwa TaxID=1194695 RepID=A0A5A7TCP9_CUCMM|nr:pentatricopeptide repeat-containing protein [Cucumis melo var. makuwa]TYJ97699.1 pentatricopeptide repeat-containing protein [Cucumis melo var. makuwa]